MDETEISTRFSLANAVDTNPDYEAELQGVAKRTGVPVDAVRTYPEDAKKQDKIGSFNYDQMKAQFPNTMSFLADQQNANVSHDDIPVLQRIENVFGSVKRGWQKGSMQDEMVDLNYKNLTGDIDTVSKARLEKLEGDMGYLDNQQDKTNSAVDYFAHQSVYTTRQVGSSTREAIKGAAIGAPAGAVIGAIGGAMFPPSEVLTVPGGAMAGARAGAIANSVWWNYKAEAGGAYSEFSKLKDESGQPLSQPLAKGAAVAVGLINAALETTGEMAVVKLFPGADKILTLGPKEFVKQMLTSPTTAQRLASLGGKWVKAASAEGITEAFQELSQVLGNYAAEGVSGQQFAPHNVSAEAKRVGQAGMDAFVGTMGAGAPVVGYRSYRDIREGQRIQAGQEFMQSLGEDATESKLQTRLPEKFQQFVSKIKENGPVDNVYIPAEQFQTFFQSKGMDPAEVATQSGATNYSEALAAGTDVVIPIEKYASTLAATKLHQELMPDIKLRPNDMTARQYAEYQQEREQHQNDMIEMLKQQLDENHETPAFQKIKDDMVGQLMATGQERGNAEQSATAHAKAIVTLAERAGIDPIELSKQLTVNRPLPDILTQFQNTDINIDPLLDTLRSGSLPTNEQINGQSLMNALREAGGLIDQGGELSAMDAGKGLKPFEKSLIQPNGMTLDHAAEWAVERGYLPERDPHALLDLIDNELRGNPTYSQHNFNQKAAELNHALESLGEYLNNLGADLGQMDNQQIRQLIQEAATNPDVMGAVEQLFQSVAEATIPQTIDVDGVQRSTRNSEGRLIAFTEDHIRNFWNWFGDSKVVDENGKPLVMYRGSLDDRGETGSKDGFIHFSSDPKIAQGGERGFVDPELLKELGIDAQAAPDGLRIVPAYLSIKNPATLSDVQKVAPNAQTIREALPALKEAGFDGFMSDYETIAFNENQIKSSIGNNGDFSSTNPNILYQRVKQQAEGKQVPDSVDAVSNVDSAFEFAGSKSFPTNRDFKVALQDLVNQAAEKANVDLADFSKGTEDYLVRSAIAEGLTAMQTNANAVGWYNEKVTKALRLVSLIHPEIATDHHAKFAFVWALAVTSNGLKVDKNFELAEEAYNRWKNSSPDYEKRRMPTDIGIGQAAGPINNSLGLYNTLIEKNGFEAVEQFMTAMQKAGDIEKFTGQKITGENLTTMVYGAAALGPKIGNGFFMNLYGKFEQLTMDRWLMRTWGRWTGTLVEINVGQIKAKRDAIKSLIKALDPKQKKELEAVIKAKLKVGTLQDLDAAAIALWKASTKPALRVAMSKIAPLDESSSAKVGEILGKAKKGVARISIGDELRKVGNALTKYLDGQNEMPSGPPERANIRKVFGRALEELQKEHPALTMSDLQALLWYPEKRLYDAAKTADEATSGYEDDEAPDYANAAAKLARSRGVSDQSVTDTLAQVDSELQAAVSSGGVRPGERSLNQGNESDKRGYIQFGPDRKFNIALLEKADLSTFLHETGHFYLEIIRDLIKRPETSDQLRQDYQTLLNWFQDYAATGAPEKQVRSALASLQRDLDNSASENAAKNKADALSIKVDALAAEVKELASTTGSKSKLTNEKRKKLTEAQAALRDAKAAVDQSEVELKKQIALHQQAIKMIEDVPNLMQFVAASFGENIENPEIRTILTTPFHEYFARGNEAYLMEGKAPSSALRSVFQTFKSWLKLIYKQLTALNVKLTPEVRNVFDRIYATDQEIEAAKREVDVSALFADAADAGMTEPEFAVYAKSVSDISKQAQEMLDLKLMLQFKREHEAWWKEARERMEAEVSAEVNSQQVYAAFDALVKGDFDGIKLKLNKDALIEKYGAEYIKRLPRSFQRIYTTDGGMDAEAAASYLGYADGDALISALVDMRPRKELIKAETDARMREVYGDMMTGNNIAEEAKVALHNDMREDVLRTELKAIKRKQREVQPFVNAERQRVSQGLRQAFDIPPRQTFIDAARGLVGQTAVKDLSPYSYLLADRKYARLAEMAIKAGDYLGAADAKQKQLLNHHLYLEGVKAKAEADNIAKFVKRFDLTSIRQKIGKAGHDYLDQIDDLVNRYEFRRVPFKTLDKRESLDAWAAQQEALGNEVAIDPMLLSQARQVNYRQVSIDELRAVRDALRNIEHLARLKMKIITKHVKADFEDAVAELTASAMNNFKRKPLPLDLSAMTQREKMSDNVSRLDAMLLKMEQIVEWLDDGNVSGPWHTYLWNPIAQAQFDEYDKIKDVGAKISASLEKMPKDQRESMLDTFDIAGMGKVTRKFIVSIAMNMGNAQNIDKMMRGFGWNMGVIEAALGKLNQHDIQFVQETLDTINSLWPDIVELDVKMTGLAPKKVEGEAFEIHDENGNVIGTIEGYYPLVYDPRKSEAGAKQETGPVSQLFEEGYVRATTPKGHTQARTQGFAAPLLLDFEQVVTQHLAKVIKDLTHREAIVAANKILTNREIRSVLQETVGPAYEKQMLPWLRSVVNDRNGGAVQGLGDFSRWMMALRANVVAATMGFKVTTGVMQIVGLSQSLDKVKGKYLGQAVTDFLRHPGALTRQVRELSGEMRHRSDTLDRDIRSQLQNLTGQNSTWAKAQKFAFHGIALADAMVTVPTWMGAYRQALDSGLDEAAARNEADAAVRLTQGSGGSKDLSSIQRNNELTKTLTMFYSYFNVLYARMRDMGRDVQDIKDMPKFLSRVFFTVMIPAVMGDLIVGRGPDDDEDYPEWLIRKMLIYPMMSIPVLRDIVASLDSGRDYKFSPIATGIEKVAKLATHTPDVVTGEMDWGNYAINAAETFGYVFGVAGTAQMSATGKYLWRVYEGEEDPDNMAELIFYAGMGKRKQ